MPTGKGDAEPEIVWRPIRRASARRYWPLAVVGTLLLVAALAILAGSLLAPAPAESSATPTDHHGSIDQPTRKSATQAAREAAVALGSEKLFTPRGRDAVARRWILTERQATLRAALAEDYGSLAERLGLGPDGQIPPGARLVSTTTPHDVRLRSYSSTSARVEVPCSGEFELTGVPGKQDIPPRTSWFTMTINLTWTSEGWRVRKFTQREG